MTFCLKILGSSGAMPAYGRHHSSQLLTINSKSLLIDCGEGTQQQISRYNIKPGKIEVIFISHLHGDHYLGLMGLISSMHLQGRQKPLKVFAPPGLKDILLTQLKYSGSVLKFHLEVNEIESNTSQVVFESKHFEVMSFPLTHRIPCYGYLFREKKKEIRINKLKLPPDLSLQDIARLKKGEDLRDNEGRLLYENSDLTLLPKKSRSFAYCSDTLYDEGLLKYIQGVDLLYFESTFLEDRTESAKQTFHSTARQAGIMAKRAEVNALVIGHFSARYKDLEPFREQASAVFKHTKLAIEGQDYCVKELPGIL